MFVSKLSLGSVIKLNGTLWKVESLTLKDSSGAVFDLRLVGLVSGNEHFLELLGDEVVEDVPLKDRRLEYLYVDEDECFFLDVETLDIVSVHKNVIGTWISYLKAGVVICGSCYESIVLSVELPQFLELMVSDVSDCSEFDIPGGGIVMATLETGATIKVPSFIEVGDIVNVDPRIGEYIQRV